MSQTSESAIQCPVIFEQDGTAYTNSQSISVCFEKRHMDVLRDIRNLIDSCEDKDFNERNFALVEYQDAKGERRPMFNLTFDGFILLAMGYTGKKALQVKLLYIAEFNRMRALLEQKKMDALMPAGLSPSQQAELKALVDAKLSIYPANMQRKVRGELWTRFNRTFCIASYSQLPPEKMDEARSYIIDMELRSAPKPDTPKIDDDLSPRELRNLLAFTIGTSNGWKKAFEMLFDKLRFAK